MNKQELYNKAVTHLITQNCQSYDSEREFCSYRSPEGLMCVIGALIPDDLYDPKMEGVAVNGLLAAFPEVKRFLEVESEEDDFFLRSLQDVHDDYVSYNTKHCLDKLRSVAVDYGLNYSILAKLTHE